MIWFLKKYNSKNTTLNSIDSLSNLSVLAKEHFKDLVINSNWKEDVEKHKNDALLANNINGENIEKLNNLSLLSEVYKMKKNKYN